MKKILSLTAIVFAIALFANNANADNPNRTITVEGTGGGTVTIDGYTGNEKIKIKGPKGGKVVVRKDRSTVESLVGDRQKDKQIQRDTTTHR
ncbi:MAG: hypothetical protein IJW75_01670 [Alphaproteobacteria bacterium]|nr:hypothetical protein [Alphaproteobacteria bacterium]